MNGVIDIKNATSAPNVYGGTTIGTEQQNLATYDPKLKRIRNMSATERMRMRPGQVPNATAPDAADPDLQLHTLQGAAVAQQQDQQAQQIGAFAGLGRVRRR